MNNVVNIAKLLADNSRVAILTALMSDKALTPSELALIANITPQTVTSHLLRLEQGGLLTFTSAGRHKYYYLASDKVAELLETVYQLSPLTNLTIPSHQRISSHLKEARTCYKHLAGALATTLANNLIKEEYLQMDNQLAVTNKGNELFSDWGIENIQSKGETPLIKLCLDWTERKFHIGGILGKELLTTFFIKDWLRKGKVHRSVYLTETGRRALSQLKLL